MNNNILWIGALSWLNNDLSYFPNVTYPGIVSGSAFQQSIIEGLEKNNQNVQILTDCDMGTGIREEWSHNGKTKDIKVAGKKGKFRRILSKIYYLIKEIKNKIILEKKDVVIAYEMHLPYLLALRKIKMINKNISTILICPDLSIYMDVDLKKKPIKRFAKKIENFIINMLLKYVDGVVVFTEQMYEYFRDKKMPYVVIEGVCRNKFPLEIKCKKNYILHAGSLHKNMGIEELIEAFEQLEHSKIELWFCGKGAMDQYIYEKMKQNNRIKHLGFVSPNILFEYEKEALMLVNVRNPLEEYTKYSFPSKTFEYMASGTILLSTYLEGIPQEYNQHMVLIKNNSIHEIIEGINKILMMPESKRLEFGLSAREFVLTKKNDLLQSLKIIKLINQIRRKKEIV